MEATDISALFAHTHAPIPAMKRAEEWASAFGDTVDRNEARVMLPTVFLGHFAILERDGPLVSSVPVPGVEKCGPDDLFRTCLQFLDDRARVLLFAPDCRAWGFDVVRSMPPRTVPVAAGVSAGVEPPAVGVLHRSQVLQTMLSACTLGAPVVTVIPYVGTLSVVSRQVFESLVAMRETCRNSGPDAWHCTNVKPPLAVIERRVPLWKSWFVLVLYAASIAGLTSVVYLTSSARDTYSFIVALELAVASAPILLGIFSLPYSLYEASFVPGRLAKLLNVLTTPGYLQRLLNMSTSESNMTDQYEVFSSEFGLTHEHDMALIGGPTTGLPQAKFQTFRGPAPAQPNSGFPLSEDAVSTLVVHTSGKALVSPLTGFPYSVHQCRSPGDDMRSLCLQFDFDTPPQQGLAAAGEFILPPDATCKVQDARQNPSYLIPQTVNLAPFAEPWEPSSKESYHTRWAHEFAVSMARKLDRVDLRRSVCKKCQAAKWFSDALCCLSLARNELGTIQGERCCHGTIGCSVSSDLRHFLKSSDAVFDVRKIVPMSFRSEVVHVTTDNLLVDMRSHIQTNHLTGRLELRDLSFFPTISRLLAAVRALNSGHAVAYGTSLDHDGVEIIAARSRASFGQGESGTLPDLGGLDHGAINAQARVSEAEEARLSHWSMGASAFIGLFAVATAVLSIKSAIDADETWYSRLTAVFFWPAFGLTITISAFRLLMSMRVGRGWLPTPERSVMRTQAELDRMDQFERASLLVGTLAGRDFQHGVATYALPFSVRGGELNVPPICEGVARTAGLVTTSEGTLLNVWGLFEAVFHDNRTRVEWRATTRKASLTELKAVNFGPLR